MASFGQTINNTYNILKDMLNTPTGSVGDMVLHYINRGQDRICNEKPWDILQKEATLTLVGNSAVLPSDFDGSIREVFTDVDGDGKPDVFYYLKGRSGIGYELTTTFDQTSGHVWTIRFYSAPQGSVIIRYKTALDDFQGTVVNSVFTEKSFFPCDLLLAASYLEYLEDSGIDGNLLSSQKGKYDAAIKKFNELYQDMNVDMRSEARDAHGNLIYTDDFTMDGDYSSHSIDLQSASRSRFP